jgi:hypothetical protein
MQVPDEGAVVAWKKNAVPLELGAAVEASIEFCGSLTHCIHVPDEACLGDRTTLQVDVLADTRLTLRLKHKSPAGESAP